MKKEKFDSQQHLEDTIAYHHNLKIESTKAMLESLIKINSEDLTAIHSYIELKYYNSNNYNKIYPNGKPF